MGRVIYTAGPPAVEGGTLDRLAGGCRRLRIRYDRDSERLFAFATLACARLGCNWLPCTAEAHPQSP